ncbi:MAG: hypothetical protein H6722_02880 [Sandaracinus sp.]|nr:hypothetical protein [Sandaracinus sp.]
MLAARRGLLTRFEMLRARALLAIGSDTTDTPDPSAVLRPRVRRALGVEGETPSEPTSIRQARRRRAWPAPQRERRRRVTPVVHPDGAAAARVARAAAHGKLTCSVLAGNAGFGGSTSAGTACPLASHSATPPAATSASSSARTQRSTRERP